MLDVRNLSRARWGEEGASSIFAKNRLESKAICLTFEFKALADAEDAAMELRSKGEHVEGPMEYGP
jgi:hypothetical protein